MPECRGLPCRCQVTHIALLGCAEMPGVFIAAVACGAGARRNTGVVKESGLPCRRRVAVFAGVSGIYVPGVFSLGHRAIVTTEATGRDRCMIEARGRPGKG